MWQGTECGSRDWTKSESSEGTSLGGTRRQAEADPSAPSSRLYHVSYNLIPADAGLPAKHVPPCSKSVFRLLLFSLPLCPLNDWPYSFTYPHNVPTALSCFIRLTPESLDAWAAFLNTKNVNVPVSFCSNLAV